MPLGNTAAHQARCGMFNVTRSDRHTSHISAKFQGMIAVFNTPIHRPPEAHVPAHDAVYQAQTIPMIPSGREESAGRVVVGGIGAAMKRHPVATAVVVTTAVLATVGLVAKSAPGNSPSEESRLDRISQPHSLSLPVIGPFANSATVVDMCERTVRKFPSASDTQAGRLTMQVLQSIKSSAEDILRVAGLLVRDSAVELPELENAARCSGVSLKQNKVEPMIAYLEARISLLQEGGGVISIDGPRSSLSTQMLVSRINQKLLVLKEIDGMLYSATATINERILQLRG